MKFPLPLKNSTECIRREEMEVKLVELGAGSVGYTESHPD